MFQITLQNSLLVNIYLWFQHVLSGFRNNLLFWGESTTSQSINIAQEDADVLARRLIDDYGNAILRMAYAYLHNMSDAEDILQETLLKYLQTRPSVTDTSHEKAWLLHVAANLSKNKIKYNTIRETDELNDELATIDRQDLSFVWEAIKTLPDHYRDVIHLFYYEGYGTKEIADILKRNESTIRSDLRRARLQLKDVLKEDYDFGDEI